MLPPRARTNGTACTPPHASDGRTTSKFRTPHIARAVRGDLLTGPVGRPSHPGPPPDAPRSAPLGWLAVVNPGRRTDAATRELLLGAYRLARSRHERRTG
ncbi:DUF6194 family protein [Streptomyces sp. NPDC059818]|uniref:DUF6194 family protein n=1 Tax=Streptomyces sp. NPDC059818 TaxID=3346962 RepID=UPI00364735A1